MGSFLISEERVIGILSILRQNINKVHFKPEKLKNVIFSNVPKLIFLNTLDVFMQFFSDFADF